MVQGMAKRNVNNESKRIEKTEAKLISEAMRNFDKSISRYPSTDKIRGTKNHVP